MNQEDNQFQVVQLLPNAGLARRCLDRINALLSQVRSNHKAISADELMITAKANTIILVETDGQTIGMAVLAVQVGLGRLTGHVDDVVVDEAWRGKGIGNVIMEAVIDSARRALCSRLELTSSSRRENANGLYQKFGFQIRDTNCYRLDL